MKVIEQALEYFNGYGSPHDDLIIHLLKKEIPMKADSMKSKVKAVDVESKEIHTYECTPCPKCQKYITKIYRYCPHCAQRVEELK